MKVKLLKCAIIRGGTSKGVFFLENDLPKDQKQREKVILDVFGSPDKRQIDGLGGADILTSKVAIVGVSSRPDADVDYTFGQVMIDRPEVRWDINCGNISAAVGAFAVDESLVKAVEPVTKVRIYNTNTGKILIAEVPVKNGKFNPEGDYQIDGVPGTGAKISLDFSRTAGSVTGRLLPTGKTREIVYVEGIGEVTVSIVDAGNLFVFGFARDIGLNGKEEFKDIVANKKVLERAEMIRAAAAERLGFVKKAQDASALSPTRPLGAYVYPPMDYLSHVNGIAIKSRDIDLKGIIIAAGQVHQAYAVTGTVCTGAAAKIEGTIVNEVLSDRGRREDVVRIGHPAGVIEIGVKVAKENGDFHLEEASIFRTARRIMEGYVYLKGGD